MVPQSRKLFLTPLALLLMLATLVMPMPRGMATASGREQPSQELLAGLMGAFMAATSQSPAAGAAHPIAAAPLAYLEQKVIASGAANDNLGWSVALAGDTALVGAYRDDVGVLPDQGSAYVFVRSGTTWYLQQVLTASDGGDGDQFGCSVALSADGNTALVGAYTHDVGLNEDQGAAYVFTRSGSVWTQQAQLTAADGAADDHFGGSVALDGDTALVGAWYDDVGADEDQGSVYVLTRSGSVWSQQAQLSIADGAPDDHLGTSVAIEGDTALLGAAGCDVGANADQGSAYVFTRSGTTWSQQAQLLAAGGAAGDEFGSCVALSGETALVGAWYDDIGANANQGSAYVFTRSGTTWSQQAQLVAADGASGDWFGFSVALSGDTALVGANADDVGANANQGSAYVFTRSGAVWTQRAQLTAGDGAANDFFGRAVALSGDTALAGAWGDDIGANNNQGSAYLFTGSGATWAQQQKVTASDGEGEDQFGWSVALEGDTALVGVYLDDVEAGDQGSVYVFTRSGATWGLQGRLTATDGEIGDQFGWSVALSGNTALVGAPLDDIGDSMDQGSAYVFTRSGATWTQQARLTAADGTEYDEFGSAVALSGDTALVGAHQDDEGDNAGQGSAYIFTRSGSIWTLQARLTAAEGAAGDEFGWAVALDGDTALVGAPYAEVEDILGSAYVFTGSGPIWSQQATLIPSGADVVGYMGWAVALDGDTALVGSPGDEVGGDSSQGAAYVFTRSGVSWSQQGRLTAADGADYDEFGLAVALDGEVALVGAWLGDAGAAADQGAAYLFTRAGMTWSPQAKLLASDGAVYDGFGWSVALSGETALVGAPGDDVGANEDQGSAYFYFGSAPIAFRIYLPVTLLNTQ